MQRLATKRLAIERLWAVPALGVAGLVAWIATGQAIAAEQVLLKYSILRETVSVAELTALAERGELSSGLRTNLSLAGQNPAEVRKALSRTVKVNPLLVDRLLNSRAGNLVLDEISTVIHTPSGRGDRQALRGALTLATADDGQVSLIEVIQKYPTQEVQVEGDRLVDAYRQIQALSGQLPGVDLLNKLPF
jgi:hypothetical protein